MREASNLARTSRQDGAIEALVGPSSALKHLSLDHLVPYRRQPAHDPGEDKGDRVVRRLSERPDAGRPGATMGSCWPARRWAAHPGPDQSHRPYWQARRWAA